MKKLIIVLCLMTFTVLGISQSAKVGLFQPVPANLFENRYTVKADVQVPSVWLLRLNTGVMGTSYGINKVTKQFEVIPLSAVGFGISYLHYKSVENLPFNDFGFNLLLLQNIQSAGMGIGLYGTYNTGPLGLLNIGGHYDFSAKQFLIDTGLTFHF
jgi:hypothetical protein